MDEQKTRGFKMTPAGDVIRKPLKPLRPTHQAVVDERKATANGGRPRRATRDALVQLQYKNMAKLSPLVLARVARALENEDDPLHEMVVEKLLMRVAPTAFWEALGKQEFGQEEEKKGVTFNINIGHAEPPKNEGAIDVVAVEKP